MCARRGGCGCANAPSIKDQLEEESGGHAAPVGAHRPLPLDVFVSSSLAPDDFFLPRHAVHMALVGVAPRRSEQIPDSRPADLIGDTLCMQPARGRARGEGVPLEPLTSWCMWRARNAKGGAAFKIKADATVIQCSTSAAVAAAAAVAMLERS
jgi:hypothetical protein